MSAFSRYVGIDYFGAETSEASLNGLRVYCAVGEYAANEVPPPPSPRKYWTRRGIAHWSAARLAEDVPTIVGIDHGFSFSLGYFDVHQLKPDWPSFLEDFQRHWPTDAEHPYVDFVRDGAAGNGAARTGNARWRRMTEQRARSAKSVFHFDVVSLLGRRVHWTAANESGTSASASGVASIQMGTRNGRFLLISNRAISSTRQSENSTAVCWR